MNVLAMAGAIGLGAVVAAAEPASAHGLGGLHATNYESRVVRVHPAVRGLAVRVVDLGDHIEVVNRTGSDIEQLADGRVRRHIPAGTTVQWHEHDAHWDDDVGPPPAVDRDPGSEHLIRRWAIVLRQGGKTIRVEGELRWVPGPSPWPWLALAAAALVAVVVGTWRRDRRAVLAIALATLVAAQLVHVVGAWGASTSSAGSHLVASVYSLAGVALALTALVTLERRDPTAAAPFALLAGLALALAGGLADVTSLTRSQLPFTLAAWVDRLSIALTLGIGAGVAVAGARRLRRSRVDDAVPTDTGTTSDAVPAGLQARYRAPS